MSAATRRHDSASCRRGSVGADGSGEQWITSLRVLWQLREDDRHHAKGWARRLIACWVRLGGAKILASRASRRLTRVAASSADMASRREPARNLRCERLAGRMVAHASSPATLAKEGSRDLRRLRRRGGIGRVGPARLAYEEREMIGSPPTSLPVCYHGSPPGPRAIRLRGASIVAIETIQWIPTATA